VGGVGLRFSVRAEVTGLDGIADPEGQTIERALPLLGFGEVGHLRVGKVFRFTLEAPDLSSARTRAEQLCDRLLANPVIERSAVVVEPAGEAAGRADRPVPAGTPGAGAAS
jgi:phosphoribosylformylglycinamidine synthase PurS subunit